ncbi:DUF7507 domain-containing protein [Arcticibacterium luteifluviistationis]|uniref:DUF7507 domain-containing protein n=1 Tax=Arcticibacterium luteifluviistationis TaxID=1784714 RepID=A0A2Z4GAR2_9BACT|nr:ice-binding family protein [Arcticibacterium luteifluviistationis]AWV98211.1 hypothetical protein DJ013_08505 [Arcticibacterium luteifluviistationis]
MKKNILLFLTTVALVLFSKVSFSQTPNGTVSLGILSSFEGYSGAGAVTNSGLSWKGDAGTNIGIMSGFQSPSFTDNTYNADAVTAQARADLFRLYIHLNDLFVTFPGTHAAAFGGGETLLPGVYSIPGAGSLGTNITLDGEGDPNAFFIIKYNGAMTVGANATVTLINNAQSCNVFWIAEGAISVAAGAKLKGTLFAHIGAVGLGAGAELEGRMFTLEGAIVSGADAKVSPPPGICTIPIFCETGCSPAPAVDVLGVLSNFALYTNSGAIANTSTSGIDGNIGTHSGGVSGFASSVVIGDPYTADAITAQAKIDIDSAYIKLMDLPNTVPSAPGVLPEVLNAHTAAFGGGEILKPGVYFINGAGSISGTLTLDGENDPDAIFVFKIAGALSVAAQSKIILANGARRCNVFWIGGAGVATGAISIGAASVLKGTFLSHGGACGSGAGVFLAGRQLSTGGAVNTYSGIVYNNPVCVTSKSLSEPVINAVADTTEAVNGLTGGTTSALTLNDILDGFPVVIGVDSGDVTLTGLTVPAGLTLSIDGTVTIDSNTAAGNYSLTYKICEVTNPTNCDSVTSTIVVSTSSLALVKSGVISGTGTGLLGEVITYTFAVTNTGSTTLTNVVVADTMVGLTISGNPIVYLAGGDSSSAITGTYTITEADIEAGGVTNSALATATDPADNDITDISGTAKNNDLSTVTTVTRSSSIALVKTESVGGTGVLGDVITYSFKVINTGNGALTNVVVTDTMIGLTITGNPIISLAAGDSSSAITGTYTITQANIDAGGVTNSALVTAKDPTDNDITDISGTSIDNDISTVTTISRVSAIALVKTGQVSGTGILGDVITYIFTVTNTGNSTLTNVVVTDTMVAITGSPISSLAPGTIAIAMATYTITQTDIDSGSVTNSALATAKDPDGVDVSDVSGTANDNDTPTVTVTPTLIAALPDFTLTIDIDALGFSMVEPTKDFVVNISEINGAPSDGQVVFQISKGNAFLVNYASNTSNSNVNGGVLVNNTDWEISNNTGFIKMSLKVGATIGANAISKIGFTITRKTGVPTQTTQPITVTIVNSSGLDSRNYNNTYGTVVTAQ